MSPAEQQGHSMINFMSICMFTVCKKKSPLQPFTLMCLFDFQRFLSGLLAVKKKKKPASNIDKSPTCHSTQSVPHPLLFSEFRNMHTFDRLVSQNVWPAQANLLQETSVTLWHFQYAQMHIHSEDGERASDPNQLFTFANSLKLLMCLFKHSNSLLCRRIVHTHTHTGLLILPLHLRAELMVISVLAGSLQDFSVQQKCVYWSYYQQQKGLYSVSYDLCTETALRCTPIIYSYAKHLLSLTVMCKFLFIGEWH